jgi:glycine oxidase
MANEWGRGMLIERHDYDVLVVGGGIIGASIAFQLAKRQFRVGVLEKERIASQASSAAAGMLGAQSEFSEESPLIPLALKSRALVPELAEELKELTGIDIGLVEKGMLKVAVTEEEATALRRHYEFWRQKDDRLRWLSADEMREIEPHVSHGLAAAMYIPKDGQVSAPDFALALANASMTYGAKWYEYTEVMRLGKLGDSYVIETNRGTFAADVVIIASGAWSSLLLEQTGLSLSMYPVKGECLFVKTETSILQTTVFAKNGCYIVPKRGNRLLIGATSTPHTFDRKVSVQGMMSLLDRACRLLPELEKAEWERAWSGIRPQTGDGLPYIGEHPHYPRVWVATGHYRNGILLSPITGVLLADLVEGKETDVDLAPFSLTRHLAKVGKE